MSEITDLRDCVDAVELSLSDKNKEIERLNGQCRLAETKWLNALREATGINLNNLAEVVGHIKTLREIAELADHVLRETSKSSNETKLWQQVATHAQQRAQSLGREVEKANACNKDLFDQIRRLESENERLKSEQPAGRVVDHDNQSSSDQSDWVPKLGEPVRVKWGGRWKAGVVIKILPTQYIVKIFEDERSEGSDHSEAMLLIQLTPVNS